MKDTMPWDQTDATLTLTAAVTEPALGPTGVREIPCAQNLELKCSYFLARWIKTLMVCKLLRRLLSPALLLETALKKL
jgi:hypothetical protein